MKMGKQMRRQKTVDRRQKGRGSRASVFCLLSTVFFAFTAFSPVLSAAPTQDDVFKKIQESMSEKEEFDSRPVILLFAGGGTVLLLLCLMSVKRQKAAAPRGLNHAGKLMKEVLRDVPLSTAEVRQLKLLAEAVEQQTGEPATPLTLLLCPSLMAKGLQEKPAKLDRKVVAQVVRKMQLHKT